MSRSLIIVLVAHLSACGVEKASQPAPSKGPVVADPEELPTVTPPVVMTPKPTTPAPQLLPDVACAGKPSAPKRGWRHSIKSPAVTILGSANHRGIDLVAAASELSQMLRGDISYGLVDKALEDETVELFACRAGAWEKLGETITDDEGHFAFSLIGAARLPLGIRDLYVSVVGDRTGAPFLAIVARDGDKLFVSDVDGTLTSSENAYPLSLVTHETVEAHPGAAAALTALANKGYLPIYVSSRGRIFTDDSREWLAASGFPRGAIRLAAAPVTLPGDATVDYKRGTFLDLEATGLDIEIGFGNRGSDAEAYRGLVPGAHTFLRTVEFADETAAPIAAATAVGFESYLDLMPAMQAMPAAR